MSRYYFKHYHGLIENRKFTEIALQLKKQRIIIFGTFIATLEIASRNDIQCGCLHWSDLSKISSLAEITPKLLDKIFQQFIQLNMIAENSDGYSVTNWHEYQSSESKDKNIQQNTDQDSAGFQEVSDNDSVNSDKIFRFNSAKKARNRYDYLAGKVKLNKELNHLEQKDWSDLSQYFSAKNSATPIAENSDSQSENEKNLAEKLAENTSEKRTIKGEIETKTEIKKEERKEKNKKEIFSEKLIDSVYEFSSSLILNSDYRKWQKISDEFKENSLNRKIEFIKSCHEMYKTELPKQINDQWIVGYLQTITSFYKQNTDLFNEYHYNKERSSLAMWQDAFKNTDKFGRKVDDLYNDCQHYLLPLVEEFLAVQRLKKFPDMKECNDYLDPRQEIIPKICEIISFCNDFVQKFHISFVVEKSNLEG